MSRVITIDYEEKAKENLDRALVRRRFNTAINKALEDAIYHIERNGNAKIILLDLSMQLTRYLHQKEE